MTQDLAPDTATLHAYVDGQLAAEQAAQVADWLLRHPDQARRVLDWREQREALQALRPAWLEEPVPVRLSNAWVAAAASASASPAASPPWPRAWAAAVLVALGLGVGLIGGWSGHQWWAAPAEDDQIPTASASPDGMASPSDRLGQSPPGTIQHPQPADTQANGAAPASGQGPGTGAASAQVPAFVRDAAIAHAVYQPEIRHPVEVTGDQQDHLVQWLSKRLGQPLHIPPLDDQGYRLVGGRLLPAGEDDAGPLTRAQFMYEDLSGQRLTLYVSVGASTPQAPVAFRLTQRVENGQTTRSLYWIDGKLGYALSGTLDEQRLRALADLVHARLR